MGEDGTRSQPRQEAPGKALRGCAGQGGYPRGMDSHTLSAPHKVILGCTARAGARMLSWQPATLLSPQEYLCLQLSNHFLIYTEGKSEGRGERYTCLCIPKMQQ